MSLPQRLNSSSPSDDDTQYYGPHGSTHSRHVPQPHLFIQTAPVGTQRNGPGFYSGTPVADGLFDSHLYPHPNSVAPQHRSDWATQDSYGPDSAPHYPPTNSPRINHLGTTFSGTTQGHDHAQKFSQDSSSLSHYDTVLASPHTYQPPSAYSPSLPNSALFDPTTYVDHAQGGGYGQPIPAPQPSSNTFPNIPHLPYVAPIIPKPSIMSFPDASYPGHTDTPTVQMCEWDGCNQPLVENSRTGVRRHLREHHYKGKPPSAKDVVKCKWGGSCRREPMQWENIPKHISECHTKTMTRVCALCGESFARSDTLKRHKEAGSCSGSRPC